MNPAILKLIAKMKGAGQGAMNFAGAKGGELAGMAARNPKTAAGIGALGAGGIGAGAGAAMGDEGEGENIEEILEMLSKLKERGQRMM